MSVIIKNRFNRHINGTVFICLIIYNISYGWKNVTKCPSGREADMPVDFLTTEQTESYGRFTGSVAKIVKLEHAWRRLDGRNDDGFQVAPFPG